MDKEAVNCMGVFGAFPEKVFDIILKCLKISDMKIIV